MSNGANFVHKQLRTELENYIKSQYFGKSPILISALTNRLDDEGLLYKKPFIESSPAYISVINGLQQANIDNWLKEYFVSLSAADIGVFNTPFEHQIKALENAIAGKDLFVSTGTGSGKTECFMWPILAKMAEEARNSKKTWSMRGIRTIIMYPMNALVSDQVARLRRMIGDPDSKFLSIFQNICGYNPRRPQFGMYTGRTPYPGQEPTTKEDRALEKTLRKFTLSKAEKNSSFYNLLLKEGKIPAKADMEKFLECLHNGKHIPCEEDAELITRFEMQQFCPDILITNYSMLEYMLLRPLEQKIWTDTQKWLNESKDNKILFVIDEAHMYKGSSGGEVALLIRRLFYKLGITRDKVQFILTTASMPNKDEKDRSAVMRFADELTAANIPNAFCYLTGKTEKLAENNIVDINISYLLKFDASTFEADDETKLSALIEFWSKFDKYIHDGLSLEKICNWMYHNLTHYRPFYELIKLCRGDAVSLGELAEKIFPNNKKEEALNAIAVLLAIAPLAKNEKGSVLFPARMHMLFKGISGVFACLNPECPNSHTDGTITLGELFLSDENLTCPHCGSVVYELYNDRRCGALFIKGYILKTESTLKGNLYLWRYSGQLIDNRMKEIHLYLPTNDYINTKKTSHPILPCYLDIKSGYINFTDDSSEGNTAVRKLYYCDYSEKGRPQLITFSTCPHCKHTLSNMQLTSFNTRGNLSFFNLIKAQFQLQPAVSGKDNDPLYLPNQGRKVLLFSDSRQRAAKLARDMSEASDISVARQLFVLAINTMENSTSEQSMDALYDYFCLEAGKSHVKIFHDDEKIKFVENCNTAINNYRRTTGRGKEYTPRFHTSNAPVQMQEYMLKLFAGGYNTLYDSAICWIEPTYDAMDEAISYLSEKGINVSESEFLELFNAWILFACDSRTCLGNTISDVVRYNVRKNYNYSYGLEKNWNFSKVVLKIMGWSDNQEECQAWKSALKQSFLDSLQPDNGRLYIDLTRVKPRYDSNHVWIKCEQCSELSPFPLMNHCPICGSEKIHIMKQEEYQALAFWREPIFKALNGEKIQVIDTEEHTAQLSYKDQRDEMWSKTEQYELRFQDIIQEDESPVDILSSTTTMEVGIDIGSLVAVGLRNIPPLRENYQQRAGRAGRRGSSLSTIITFCEDGPHDTLYFRNPIPMFRGDPRKPWIDISSKKLLNRHLAMVIIQEYLRTINTSLDTYSADKFLDNNVNDFFDFVKKYIINNESVLLPENSGFDYNLFEKDIVIEIISLKQKWQDHPELFQGTNDNNGKSLLDAFYEEGIIPTYSFPKNVVSTYISDHTGKIKYQVDRGLDIAIGEYAPGRAIVVDKQTYQIGGLFYPGSEKRKGKSQMPARSFIEDANYNKPIISCNKCGWFGLKEESADKCPFCGNTELVESLNMLKPWGFAPRNGESIPNAQLDEQYTHVQEPLYSTLPDADKMKKLAGCENIRFAPRTNQRIIMLNKGIDGNGFIVCKDCGAAMPGNLPDSLKGVDRTYKLNYTNSKCKHNNVTNVNLGYDFVTDMLVLEFALDNSIIETNIKNSMWIARAGQSLSEAFRLAASKKLDVDFTELITGYRFRTGEGISYLDIYIYDSLSSGAGYAVSVAECISELLNNIKDTLSSCNCESSCSKCLKHYRNQYVHGILDRHAALELLQWGMNNEKSKPIPESLQEKYIFSLSHVLEDAGFSIIKEKHQIVIEKNNTRKRIEAYPAMWVEPSENNTIYISDAYLKYAKPYAVQKIKDAF